MERNNNNNNIVAFLNERAGDWPLKRDRRSGLSVHTGSLERPPRVDRADHGDAQARSWGALPPSALRALGLPCSGSCRGSGPVLGAAASTSQASVSPRAHALPLIQDQSLPYGPGPSPPPGPQSRSASGPGLQRVSAHCMWGTLRSWGPTGGIRGWPRTPRPQRDPVVLRVGPVCQHPLPGPAPEWGLPHVWSALCPSPFHLDCPRAAKPPGGCERAPSSPVALASPRGVTPRARGLPHHHCGGDLGAFSATAPAEVQTHPAWRDLRPGRRCCARLCHNRCAHCRAVVQSCPTICDPMDHSMPGFVVLHCLPEFAQTHVHWVSDASQPSYPLSSPSPPTFFTNESTLHIRWPKDGASVLSSLLPIQGWFPLGLTGWISLLCKGLSRVFSSTIVQKHQFFGTQPSLRSNSHIHTWLLEKPHSPTWLKTD